MFTTHCITRVLVSSRALHTLPPFSSAYLYHKVTEEKEEVNDLCNLNDMPFWLKSPEEKIIQELEDLRNEKRNVNLFVQDSVKKFTRFLADK
jgi:hypothetical protein